ncbi:hypothetical protein GCM10020295_68300 [Streptomyces cinereospinus]
MAAASQGAALGGVRVDGGAVRPEGDEPAVQGDGRRGERREQYAGDAGGRREAGGEVGRVGVRGVRLGDGAGVPDDRGVGAVGEGDHRFAGTGVGARVRGGPGPGGQVGQERCGHGRS